MYNHLISAVTLGMTEQEEILYIYTQLILNTRTISTINNLEVQL
jgi:hypothetical protein